MKGITRGRIVRHGGVTYARLRGKVGPQLPCPEAEHPGTPRLFTDMHFPEPMDALRFWRATILNRLKHPTPNIPLF